MYSKYYITLLLLTIMGVSVEGRRQNSECADVKQVFLSEKPTVAATIADAPEYDGSLELCRFTNHTESRRLSCCTHDTERELLLTAQAEYTDILQKQTLVVMTQMNVGQNLPHHFERMLAISKRMTEFEMGNALRLHHITGREVVSQFYNVLDRVLIFYDRTTSIFTAMDNLVDSLFVYVVREATSPGSSAEPNPEYATCVKKYRKALHPPPFRAQLENQATSLHYSAVAASYLSEAVNVTFQALYATRDFQLSHHCLRDLMKLNHCQKCYGYPNMRPCREFCEDVFLICLNRVVRLGSNWEYHRKIKKILAEYILTRVELQSLLNTFHTELKANFDAAIIDYPSYKKQLQALCGPPIMSPVQSSVKSWSKPQTTSYEGDFTGDLRALVVNLELNVQGFYTNLHSSICANEPPTRMTCWDGLTESFEVVDPEDEKNKQRLILEFSDEFAPYPDKNEEVLDLIHQIKRIRGEVLKIFLKSSDQDGAEDSIDGSGSGDGESESDYDNEGGDVDEYIPTRNANLLGNNPGDAVTSKLSTIYRNAPDDSSIEIIDPAKVTPKPSARTSRAPRGSKLPVEEKPPGSSGSVPTLSLAFINTILVFLYILH